MISSKDLMLRSKYPIIYFQDYNGIEYSPGVSVAFDMNEPPGQEWLDLSPEVADILHERHQREQAEETDELQQQLAPEL